MLPQADQAVISSETCIPGLALMLDLQALSRRLQVSFSQLTYFNYKPGASCTISVVDEVGCTFAIMAYPVDRFAEVKAREEWVSTSVKATLLDDVCIVLVPMALDRELKISRKWSDSECCERYFRKLIKHRSMNGTLSCVILRYKPKRRIVSRLHLAGVPVAIVKGFNLRDFESALRGARLGSQISGVELLGIDCRRNTLAMAWVKGVSLCPVLSGEMSCAAFKQTGMWLAEFHEREFDTPLPFPSETVLDLIDPLRQIGQDFSILHPRLSSRLHYLVDQVSEVCKRGMQPATLIHGDFSADQVIIPPIDSARNSSRQQHPVVIDWDCAMIGSPLRDVGCFLARLDQQALDGSIDTRVAMAAQRAFIGGYRNCLPETNADLLNAFHARALLMLITEGFRRRHSCWDSTAEALLDRVESLMKSAADVARELQPAAEQDVSLVEPLAAAMNADTLQHSLHRLIAPAAECVLIQQPTLLRFKQGRRALIHYELHSVSRFLECQQTVMLGKLRFRSPDLQTPVLHDKLRCDGLDEKNSLGVSVPLNLGVHPDLNIWFQTLSPGRELCTFLGIGNDIRPFWLAGRALAVLHSVKVQSPRQWSMSDEAQVLDKALVRAIQARPVHGGRIQSLRSMAGRLYASLPRVPAQFIHRDFYQDQLLIDGEKVSIIDLDLCAQGDPAIDVGNFLAHIREYAVRQYGNVFALQSQSSAFLEGYSSQCSCLNAWRISVLEALSLARHIHISSLFSERQHTTTPLLDYCELRMSELTYRQHSVSGRALSECPAPDSNQ